MTRLRVLIRDQQGYDLEAVRARAREIVETLGTGVAGKTILVKPSFVYPSRSPEVIGVITHPVFVAGVCRALKDLGAKRVLVGESSVVGPSRVSFESVGILPLLKGVAEPAFLDEAEQVEVQVKDPWVQERFTVPRIVLDADLYVSLPKIKTNMFAELTLSIKNNLGLLRQRDRLVYHDYRLHKKLADLYKVRPPDLVLSDCIVAGEGQGPMMALPVPLGLIIGSNNAVASDVVACRLAGYDTNEIEHLKLLIEAGYGPGSIDEIDLDGAELLSRGRPFARPDPSPVGISPRLTVYQGTERFCPWGCSGLIRGAVDAYIALLGADNLQPMNVILGQPVTGLPEDLDPRITLVLGDCAREHAHRGEFVKGCCPRPLDIGMVIRRILGPVAVDIAVSDVMRAYTGHGLWRVGRMLGGQAPPSIENHVGMVRVLSEFYQMNRIRRRHQDQS